MAQETASMNDERVILKLGLVVDAHTTTQDVEAALDAGLAHIHVKTSHAPMDAVGGALQNRPRERVFVTVSWSEMSGDNAVEVDLWTSLQRLNLSYVDLYLLPSSASDAWGAMEHVRDVGLARSIGVSGFDAAQLAQLQASAKNPSTVNQLESRDLSPGRLRILDVCAAKNTIVAQVPPGEDLMLTAVDEATICEAQATRRKQAAASFRHAGLDEATSPIDIPRAPAVPMVDAPYHTASVTGSDQSSMDGVPPPSKAAPAPPSLTFARSIPFGCLGVVTVELGYTLAMEELVAWLEYRSSARTVQFAIWVYVVPVAMYGYYLRWRAR